MRRTQSEEIRQSYENYVRLCKEAGWPTISYREWVWRVLEED